MSASVQQGGDKRNRAEVYLSDGRCILLDVDSSTTAASYVGLFDSKAEPWWVLPSGVQILNTRQIVSIVVTERDA